MKKKAQKSRQVQKKSLSLTGTFIFFYSPFFLLDSQESSKSLHSENYIYVFEDVK